MEIVILLVLIAIIAINVKFFMFWLLCMISTLVHKHEILRSLFNILAIATCKKKMAVYLLEIQETQRTQKESDAAIARDEISSNVKTELTKKTKFKGKRKKVSKSVTRMNNLWKDKKFRKMEKKNKLRRSKQRKSLTKQDRDENKQKFKPGKKIHKPEPLNHIILEIVNEESDVSYTEQGKF